MGSKYPLLKPVEIIRVLKHFGFIFKSQKGSHAKYIKIENNKVVNTVIIPLHNIIARGTLQSILEQASISIDNFLDKLNK